LFYILKIIEELVLSHLNYVLMFKDDRIWMYKARRMDAYFRGELNKFIEAAENHARNEKTQRIPCPCKICKNMRVLSDTTIIRSHVLVGDFVENYTPDISWRESTPSDGESA
jgi:hypothetical protein